MTFRIDYIYMGEHLKYEKNGLNNIQKPEHYGHIEIKIFISVIILPVCVRVCLFKSKVSLNPLPQNVHKYRFVSEWHFM